MSVGANIKKRRFELNMTQQDLASAMGYKTRSTIAKIESGENDVTHKKLAKFAEVLDTSIEALMGISENHGKNVLPEVTSTDLSPNRNRNVAIILAGGKSIRNHKNIPNQFIDIHGKPIIVYCLEAYQNHPAIDDIYIVCLRGWENIVSAYAEEYGITKLRGLIAGAESGILSVENGLNHVKDRYEEDDIIIFQESTRPMVNSEMISNLLQACNENGRANICQSMKDNVQFTFINGKAHYVDRENTFVLQSPEAYRLGIIRKVFQDARRRKHALTESCCAMLMYNLGYDIHFIEGSINNTKIVREEDITLFASLVDKS